MSKDGFFISKIDGLENPSLKIDGFGRTHRTHADDTPELEQRPSYYFESSSLVIIRKALHHITLSSNTKSTPVNTFQGLIIYDSPLRRPSIDRYFDSWMCTSIHLTKIKI